MKSFRFPVGLFLIFLAAALLRITLAIVIYGNFDMESYQIVTHIARIGENVYAVTERYNYSPLWFHVLTILDSVREISHIQLYSLVRATVSLVDLINAALLGLIAAQIRPSWGRRAAILYALNPAAILISGYHGQFEALAVLPILVGVYGTLRYQWRFWQILVLVVIGVVIKQNALVVAWALLAAFFGYRRAIIGCLVALIVFLISLVPYASGAEEAILRNVLTYSGVNYGFGLAGILPRTWTLALMSIGLFVAPALFRHTGWLSAIIGTILIWFVTGSYAMQYVTYLFLFAAFVPKYRLWLMATALVVALAEGARIDVEGWFWSYVPLILLTTWTIFAMWFIQMLYAVMKQKAAHFARMST